MLRGLRALAVVLLLALASAPVQCLGSCNIANVPPCHHQQGQPSHPAHCVQQHPSAVFDRAGLADVSASDVLHQSDIAFLPSRLIAVDAVHLPQFKPTHSQFCSLAVLRL